MKRCFYKLVEVLTKAKAIRHTENFYYYYLTICISAVGSGGSWDGLILCKCDTVSLHKHAIPLYG
jgi:hypothetical protein